MFVGSLLVLLAAMTGVSLAQHLGLLWVAIETTTLATAPLIYFKHDALSLEATWKYLLVCSVGIALALLGTFFLALASPGRAVRTLLLPELVGRGRRALGPWLRAAFVFLLVGYGTKMGLAPLHTWKPDAYGEAPGRGRGAAGGRRSPTAPFWRWCACPRSAGGRGGGLRPAALLVIGLLSMAVAAVFMVGQTRLQAACWPIPAWSTWASWCWASAWAARPVFGRLLHMVNNGLTKGVLFLTAGNIHRAFGTKHVDAVSRGDSGGCRSPARCSWPASWPSPARRRSARSSASSPS